MGWADQHIQKLKAGDTVQCRPHGNSMQGKIESGNLVTLSPDVSDIEKGDIVLCKVNGSQFIHLVTAVQGDRFQISNNKGHVNGWITKNGIYGKVTRVEP
jgi:phage repressor protein C with HTH and peptisase S24 domain